MSLCVAWKWQSKFCLATDSRISGVGIESCDVGIKLLQVPIRVFTPAYQGEIELIHEGTLGLAFSGSYMSGFLTKERVAEVLYNLQFIGSADELTFDRIVEVVRIAFHHSMHALRAAGILWDTELLLIGTCPSSSSPKAYYVFPKDEETTEVNEVLTANNFDYFAIGAGADYYNILMEDAQKQPIRVHFKALELLWNAIEQDAVKTVGGDVQYGDLDAAGNFQLIGVMHYPKEGEFIRPRASCRGVDIEALQSQNPFNLLHVRYSFIDPFNPHYKA